MVGRSVWLGAATFGLGFQLVFAAGPLVVRDFGARGNGVADDTSAIQNALAAGLDVYVPPGTYRVRNLKLRDGSRISGAGSASVLVLGSKEKTDWILEVGNGGTVENLVLSGGQEKITRVEEEEPALLRIDRKRNVTIRQVGFRDYGFTGLGCWHSQNLLIAENDFRNLNEALRLRHCDVVQVLDNTVVDAKFHGIEFWGNRDNKFVKQAAADLIISGNYVKDGGGGAVWGAGTHRVVVAQNIVDGAEDIGLDLEWCTDSILVGNLARNCENAGISLFFSCRRVAIVGNTIVNDRSISPSPFKPEDPQSKFFVRSGLWLTYPNRDAYKGDRGHRDVTVVGNTVWCAGGERRAAWIGSESDNVLLSANTFDGGSAWYGGQHNVHPLKVTPIRDNLIVRQPFQK